MADALPRITVFIPTYNRVALLRNAVRSAIECGTPVLVHVLDNHSTDGTEEWLRTGEYKAHPHLRVTRHPSNIGGGLNYAAGFSSVDTEFLVPLADDDELVPGFLATAIREGDSFPSVCAVVGKPLVQKGQRWVAGRFGPTTFGLRYPKDHIIDFMTHGHYKSWSACLWRTSHVQANDAFGRALSFGLPSDVYFQFQLFTQHPAFLLSQAAATYATTPGQASSRIGTSGASILDLGRLAEAMYNDLVNAPLDLPPSECRALISRSVHRWCRIVQHNRRRLVAIPDEAELKEAITAFVNSLMPYAALSDWPFSPELVALAQDSTPRRPAGSRAGRLLHGLKRRLLALLR